MYIDSRVIFSYMQCMYQRGFASKMKQNFFYKMWSKPLNFGGDTSMAL